MNELLLTFLRRTADRLKGCLNLTLNALDTDHGRVTLSEKDGQAQTLLLSVDLVTELIAMVQDRGARARRQVFDRDENRYVVYGIGAGEEYPSMPGRVTRMAIDHMVPKGRQG